MSLLKELKTKLASDGVTRSESERRKFKVNIFESELMKLVRFAEYLLSSSRFAWNVRGNVAVRKSNVGFY